MAQNTVMVGDSEALFTDRFIVRTPNWISIETLTEPVAVTVMTRYRDRETTATLHPLASGNVEVCLSEPKRAVTPGQAAVFYQDEVLVGGGVIQGS